MKKYEDMTIDELFGLYEQLEQEKILSKKRVMEIDWQQYAINSYMWDLARDKINPPRTKNV